MNLADLLHFDGLLPSERRIVDLVVREGLSQQSAARRLGITRASLQTALSLAKRRAAGLAPAWQPSKPAYRMDDGWLERNARYVRSIAHDPDHVARYLRGVEAVWGQAWADRVEQEAGV